MPTTTTTIAVVVSGAATVTTPLPDPETAITTEVEAAITTTGVGETVITIGVGETSVAAVIVTTLSLTTTGEGTQLRRGAPTTTLTMDGRDATDSDTTLTPSRLVTGAVTSPVRDEAAAAGTTTAIGVISVAATPWADAAAGAQFSGGGAALAAAVQGQTGRLALRATTGTGTQAPVAPQRQQQQLGQLSAETTVVLLLLGERTPRHRVQTNGRGMWGRPAAAALQLRRTMPVQLVRFLPRRRRRWPNCGRLKQRVVPEKTQGPTTEGD